jgi:hypothetical protein
VGILSPSLFLKFRASTKLKKIKSPVSEPLPTPTKMSLKITLSKPIGMLIVPAVSSSTHKLLPRVPQSLRSARNMRISTLSTKVIVCAFLMFVAKNSESVDSDGIQKFFEDINVDLMDASTLAFAYLCKAKAMVNENNCLNGKGVFTKDEFCTGLAAVKYVSVVLK